MNRVKDTNSQMKEEEESTSQLLFKELQEEQKLWNLEGQIKKKESMIEK